MFILDNNMPKHLHYFSLTYRMAVSGNIKEFILWIYKELLLSLELNMIKKAISERECALGSKVSCQKVNNLVTF